MIRPFEEYLKDRDVEKQLPDANESRALMSKAQRRLADLKQRSVTETNADLIFEDAYDVMREASQALMSAAGYKPLSHEVVTAYLRDKEKIDRSFVEKFDGCRKLRNRSQYSAQTISPAKAQEAIAFATELFTILNARLKPQESER